MGWRRSPFLWVLWDLWSGSVNPLRSVPYDYFYDLQARAMFHGHLYLPNGKMGIEAFVHNGHDYTYFGIFPSLIRMPILLVTEQPRRADDCAVNPGGMDADRPSSVH